MVDQVSVFDFVGIVDLPDIQDSSTRATSAYLWVVCLYLCGVTLHCISLRDFGIRFQHTVRRFFETSLHHIWDDRIVIVNTASNHLDSRMAKATQVELETTSSTDIFNRGSSTHSPLDARTVDIHGHGDLWVDPCSSIC